MLFHHMHLRQVGFVKGATTVDAPVSGGTPAAEQVGVGEPRSTGSGVVSVICFWKALHSPKPEVKEHKS